MSSATRTRGPRRTAFRAIAGPAALVLAFLWLAPGGPVAQAEDAKRVKLRLRPVASGKGVDLYRGYCLQCHGEAGKGDGPLAASLRKPPADLTLIAERNGGEFPRVAVARYIKGDRPGSRVTLDEDWNPVVSRGGVADDMPAWGYLFSQLYKNTSTANEFRFESLARHIESIQAK